MTKEELRKEFENETGITIPMANTFEYSEWLEKKLIDQSQEPKQREVSEEDIKEIAIKFSDEVLPCIFKLTVEELVELSIRKGLSMKEREILTEDKENIDKEEWINFFFNNSKAEILEYLINYKFPL